MNLYRNFSDDGMGLYDPYPDDLNLYGDNDFLDDMRKLKLESGMLPGYAVAQQDFGYGSPVVDNGNAATFIDMPDRGAIDDDRDLVKSNFLRSEKAAYQADLADLDDPSTPASGDKFVQGVSRVYLRPVASKSSASLVRRTGTADVPNSLASRDAETSPRYDTPVDNSIAMIGKEGGNRGLLNQADIRMLPRYYSNFPSQKPGQVYSPHLNFGDLSDFYAAKLKAAKEGISDTFASIPKIPSMIGAVFSDPYSVFVEGGKRMQDEQRRAFLNARQGDFRPAGEVEGKQLGSAIAGSALGWGVGKTLDVGVQSVNAMRRASMLAAEEAKAVNAARIANNVETDFGFVPQFDNRLQQLQYKWQGIKPENRPGLINSLADASAGNWVQNYQDALNTKYPGLNAHFVDKHAPDIPLRPNLEQRAIDGAHPRTGVLKSKPKGEKSSQFQDWLSMRDALNEAVTREARGLSKYSAINGPAEVTREFFNGGGRGFAPNKISKQFPFYNPQLDNWIVRFDDARGVPYTAYPY